MENYIDALLTIEKQFKPIVLDQSTISTKELTSLCEKNLYHVPQIKMILFSFHQLVSLTPWKYNSQPSWEGYNYIHEQYKNIYEKAVEIDNKITNKNDGISFSYELLQIQEKYFSRNRIIVQISCEQLQQNDVEISTTKSEHEFIVDIKFKFDKACKIIRCIKNDESEEVLNFVKDFGHLLKKEMCINYNTNKLSRAILASLPYFNLQNGNKNTEIIVFILSNVITDKQQFSGLGGMFLLIDKQCLSDIFLNIFCNIGDTMAIRFVQYYQKKILKSESLKSAVSAIMTRNMSHNLGSHYLHYTKTQLEQLAKKGGEFGPDIRGAARVMGYMQGRMDYLATLISMDRYPYGCVNFKSQIFDELTIDDFSKRHFDKEKASRTTNFLLSNLILSEGFTRSHIFNDDENIGNSINLHILFDNQIFTGIPILIDDTELDQLISREKKEGLSKEESKRKKELVDEKSRKEARKRKEEQAKQALTNINIAMPGGVMSCHAFFNVIENFIRNSAKYHQADFAKEDDKPFITITIKIEEKTEGNFDLYEFTIYDNKHNAYSKEIVGGKSTTLLELINNKFETLCILDENNAIEKSNKGFKEMLFSTIWMRTFIFMREENKNLPTNYSNVLATIQSSPNGSKKLELIQKYGFSVIAVDDKGNECPAKINKHANLALRFTLPKFKKQVVVKLSNNKNDAINSLLNVYGDITNVSQKSLYELIKKINIGKDSSLVIPRMVDKTYATDVKALEKVLKNRFKGFDNYKLSIDGAQEGNIIVKKPSHSIYFKKHLSTKSNMKYFRKYAYADSISGGNFTLTLSEIFNRWKENGWDTSTPEYYEILKIKESALTRITLIDERLYNEMLNQDNGVELACKNIRILNYHEPNSTKNFGDFKKLFIGNKFNLGRKYTHFLSIHLGLIEKIVQDSKAFKSLKDECGKEYGKYPIEERTIKFMNLLQKYFGDKNQKVFICIHSGRGNFSAELNGPLSTYPFISMSALENAYNNSKYLLSQLFYSIIYLGKGTINH